MARRRGRASSRYLPLGMRDDAPVRFAGVVDIEFDTSDPDANCLFIDLPTGGEVDVPVVLLGLTDANFGYFNGWTQPTLAIENAAGASYAALTWSAANTAQLTVGGVCTTLDIDALITNTTASGISFTATTTTVGTGHTGWALGFFGSTNLSSTSGVCGSAAGGVFEVNMTSSFAGSTSGIIAGAFIGAYCNTTDGELPTAGLWIETIAGTGVSFAADGSNTDMPMIALVTSGAGTKSSLAFEFGSEVASKTVTTTSGGMFYQGTIQMKANGTLIYMPTSTVQGTYTTAYLIQSSLATEASSLTAAAVLVAGGISVTKDMWLGGGELNVTTVATDLVIKGNTEAAFEVYDAVTKLIGVDTRNTVSGIEVITLSPGAATLPDGATSTRNGVVVKSATSTLVGTTQVTTAFDGLSFQIEVPTIAQSGGAVTVDKASTVYIAGPPTAGASVTITAGYALDVVGNSLFTGNMSVNGTTVLLDGSTSVRAVSAGFVSVETSASDFRVGYDASIYTKFAVAGTTGNLAITHVGGSTDVVTWTAAGGLTFTGAFEVVGASTFDGVTIGTATTAIHFSGTFTQGMDFADATFVANATRTNFVLGIGDRNDELTIDLGNAASQNFDPVQININLTADSGAPTSSSTFNGIYQQVTHDTVDMANLRLKGCDWTITTDKACQDAYVMQTELIVSGTKTSSGELMAMSALTTLGAGARTADRVLAFQAMISGSGTAGTVVGDAIVGYFVNGGTVVTTGDIIKCYNQSAATVVDMLELENDGTATTGLKINNDGTLATGILLEGAMTDGILISGAMGDNGIEITGVCSGNAILVTSTTATTGLVDIQLNATYTGTAQWESHQGLQVTVTYTPAAGTGSGWTEAVGGTVAVNGIINAQTYYKGVSGTLNFSAAANYQAEGSIACGLQGQITSDNGAAISNGHIAVLHLNNASTNVALTGTGGICTFIFIDNDAGAATGSMDSVMRLHSHDTPYLFDFGASGYSDGIVSPGTANDIHGGAGIRLKIRHGDTDYYLLASTTPA